MKKVFIGILAVVVFYVLCSFAFPDRMREVGSKIGLTKFHDMISNMKTGVNETVDQSDPFKQIRDAKQNALEVKQNFDNTINQKQQDLKNAAINGETTVESVQETKTSVDQSVKSLQELKGSAQSLMDMSGATIDQKQQQLNDTINKGKTTVKSVQETKASVDKTGNALRKFKSSAQHVVGASSGATSQ